VPMGISSFIVHTHVTHCYPSVYYWLYEEEGAMASSKTSFDQDDSSLGRIDTLSIVPPQTVAKGVPGFHAVTRGRGGEGGSRGLKNIFYRCHILCILVHLEIELSHLE
jgi:hypothetical protein